MNPQTDPESRPASAVAPPRRRAWVAGVYFVLFVALVAAGIAVKRVGGHAEFMMLFHLPAAVFLVLTGVELKTRRQSQYDDEVAAIRERLAQVTDRSGEEARRHQVSPNVPGDETAERGSDVRDPAQRVPTLERTARIRKPPLQDRA